MVNFLNFKGEEMFFKNYKLKGYSSKDILETLNITDNTLKYHNRNIYSKLGVKSRKQLLMYMTLLNNKRRVTKII